MLLLEVVNSRSGGVLPGKVFEYMASGAPVICVGNLSDRELQIVLASTGIGLSCGNDAGLLKDAVLSIARGEMPEWYSPEIEEIE